MLTTCQKFYRLTEVIEKLDGAISLSCLKRYCDEKRIEYSVSPGRGLRYLSEEQLGKLFPTINKEVN